MSKLHQLALAGAIVAVCSGSVALVLHPLWPVKATVIHISPKVTVAIETWAEGEGRYTIKVSNDVGSTRRELWEDWGPAQRMSLYLSPEGWVVVLGGPTHAVATTTQGLPKEVPYPALFASDSGRWRFLGTAFGRSTLFRKASEERECVDVLGSLPMPWRRYYQRSNLGCAVD